MWTLTMSWYGDRLEPTFAGRTIEETQRLLDDVGLTGPFWQLSS